MPPMVPTVAEGRHRLLHRGAELPGSWVQNAACGGRTDLEHLFFPERGVPSSIAKSLCRQCPVQVECLRFALDTRQPFGIWGGLSAEERERMLRRRRAA